MLSQARLLEEHSDDDDPQRALAMQRVMAPMQRVMASMQRVMAALPQVNQRAKQQLLVKQRPKLLQGASVDPEQQTDPFDMAS